MTSTVHIAPPTCVEPDADEAERQKPERIWLRSEDGAYAEKGGVVAKPIHGERPVSDEIHVPAGRMKHPGNGGGTRFRGAGLERAFQQMDGLVGHVEHDAVAGVRRDGDSIHDEVRKHDKLRVRRWEAGDDAETAHVGAADQPACGCPERRHIKEGAVGADKPGCKEQRISLGRGDESQ